MLVHLDILLQEIPRQEAQTQLALPRPQVEQIDRIQHLRLGHVDVDGAEILEEAVPDEHDAHVQQQPEFLVGDLEGDEVVPGARGVEVAVVHAGPFGEVVDDGLGDGDVVVYERGPLQRAAAAEDGDAREAETGGADDFAVARGGDFDFFLLEGDEFGVDCDGGAGGGDFGVRVEEGGGLGGEVASGGRLAGIGGG